MATPELHLHQALSNKTFCDLTGLSRGLFNTPRCETCKSNIIDEGKRLELIENMLFGVLKITHEIYSQMRTASPSEQPPIIIPGIENEENEAKSEVKVKETLQTI